MKILHISSAKTFGGGERHLVDLCRELVNRGHEVHVVLRPTCEWSEKLDFLPPDRILHSSIRNAFGVFGSKRIARYVNDRGIAIVHAHAARDYIPASLVCRMAKNVKFVLTRHVLFAMKPFNRIALRNVARVIAVSPPVAQNLRDIFPVDKIVTIPNGIKVPDLDAETARKRREAFRFFHGIPFDVPLIGTVGELKPLKGQHDFILAAAEIAKTNRDARFVIVGRDNSLGGEFRRELKRLAKVFELGDRILFLDWIDDLSEVLGALDLYVSPSHSESFGLAILEAMLYGVPVVATETAGAKELVDDGETGLLVPVGEAAKLASTVARLLADGPTRLRFGAAGRKVAAEKFSLEKMVDATIALYENCSGSDR